MDHCPSGLICAYARFELTWLLTGFASREVRTIGGLTRQRSRNLRSESAGRDNASDAGVDWRLSTGAQSRKQMLPEMAARPWHAPLRPDSGRDLLRTSSKLQVLWNLFSLQMPCDQPAPVTSSCERDADEVHCRFMQASRATNH